MINKVKTLGFSATALLAGLLMLEAPHQADAKVRIGVTLGTPAYSSPIVPYGDAYQTLDPYAYGYAGPAYPYPTPTYVPPAAPYFSFGWSSRSNDRHEHERYRSEFPEHHGHGDHGSRR